MCRWVQPEGWDDWANVLVLCEESAFEHLLAQLGFNQEVDLAATSVMRTFSHAAKCVIFEKYYFDIDHRSEVELVQAKQFAPVEVTADRLHFFSLPFDVSRTVLEYLKLAAKKANKEKGDEAPTYLGYSVVKQRNEARIGRSLISPWAQAPFRSADPEQVSPFAAKYGYERGENLPVSVVYEQVRTAVPESVNIYGFDFRAVGIPFMEQDGYVLRCAHVSAWICHYSAVLRGFISRKTTGQLHKAGDTTTSVARRYPSSGISSHEIAQLLREVNLAPETLGWLELNEDRDPTWADRAELVSMHRTLTEAVDAAKDDEEKEAEALRERSRLWIRENLSATVCRYLNSGFPMILIRRLTSHTQVIVGYLRESDLAREDQTASSTEGHSDVVAFLVSDDQAGPFELVPVDEIVDELAADPTSNEVFVPLPDTVWVESNMAERVGSARLLSIAERRLKRAAKSGLSTERTTQLQQFVSGLTSDEDVYTIRTYVTAGTDFKRSAAKRMKAAPDAVAAIQRTQLPRFVWVCEVIDRGLRRKGKKSVVGTIVLDATQLLHNIGPGSHTEDVQPLFAHIPSQYYAPPFLVTTTGIYPEYNEEQRATDAPKDPDELTYGDEPPGLEKDFFWYPSDLPPYWTGRWSHQRLVGLAASTVAAFAKGATS